MALMIASFLITACHETAEDNSTPKGTVSDKELGESCEYNCDEIWCFKVNFAECVSHMCVGQPDNLYCSDFCLNKTDCPDGFACTEDCDLNSQDYYCVTDADFEHLKEIGLCE